MASAHLDQNFSGFEKFLNRAGYFPVVSTFSGSVRIAFGKVQLIVSVAIAALKFVASLFTAREEKRLRLEEEAAFTLTYAKHGIANICRGYVEFVPGLNLLMIPYDLSHDRLQYPSEVPV